MHVMGVLDAIKKRGHFYNYKKAEKVHKEARKAVKSARVGLALLNGTGMKSKQFARRRPEKPQRKLLRRPKTPSQKPGMPRKLRR
jgi:hypothetical protein